MDALANRASNLLQDVLVEVKIVALEHADVVGGVHQAVAIHFLPEFLTRVIHDSIKVVGQDLLMLSLHVHIIELGDEDGVIVARTVLSQALDDIVEVGAGLFAISGRVLVLNLPLVREDVQISVVTRIRGRSQRL
uniref:Uncharacterized protein n=1 Tax=Favella ehrenbergii TaxID=182087 RepID=A0A7S3MQ34_9SPIT